MADYKDYYDFSDKTTGRSYTQNQTTNPGLAAIQDHYYGEPAKTSRVQKKVTKTTVFDFGPGPYTVDDFREWVQEIDDLPPGAKVSIAHGDSQREGEWLRFTITQGS